MPPSSVIPGRGSGGSSPYFPHTPPPAVPPVATWLSRLLLWVVTPILIAGLAWLVFAKLTDLPVPGPAPNPSPAPVDPQSSRYQAHAMAADWLASHARRLREASAGIRSGSATPGDAARTLAEAWSRDRSESHAERLAPLEPGMPPGESEGSPAHRERYAAWLEDVASGVDDAAMAATPPVSDPGRRTR